MAGLFVLASSAPKELGLRSESSLFVNPARQSRILMYRAFIYKAMDLNLCPLCRQGVKKWLGRTDKSNVLTGGLVHNVKPFPSAQFRQNYSLFLSLKTIKTHIGWRDKHIGTIKEGKNDTESPRYFTINVFLMIVLTGVLLYLSAEEYCFNYDCLGKGKCPNGLLEFRSCYANNPCVGGSVMKCEGPLSGK